jgi:hypothetical protein
MNPVDDIRAAIAAAEANRDREIENIARNDSLLAVAPPEPMTAMQQLARDVRANGSAFGNALGRLCRMRYPVGLSRRETAVIW